MTLWTKSIKLWLGSAAMLASLLLAGPSVAAYGPGNSDFGQSHDIPSPEPATLTLIALGGGAFALARYRKSRKK